MSRRPPSFSASGERRGDIADLRRAAERVLLIGLPLLLTAFELSVVLGRHTFAVDFGGVYWLAGKRVLEGVSPYTVPLQQALKYPAPAAVLFVPFALLPRGTADWVFALLVIAAIPGTLRLLGIRDWRVYAAVLLWQPVMVGWETANVSLLLALGVAAAWRWRERPLISGAIVAALVAVKIFLFPLVVWLIATRRWRATAWMVATSVVVNGASWWLLGFHQIPIYIRLLHNFTPGAEHRGYSVISLALHFSLGQTGSYALGIGLAVLVLGAAIRSSGPARDATLLTAAVMASLLASPLVESHYLTLLLVPLGLAVPSFGAIWLLPMVLLATPADHPEAGAHALSIAISSALAVCAVVTMHSGPQGRTGAPSRAVRLT